MDGLRGIYNKMIEVRDKYSYDDWTNGFASISDKRTHTMRSKKFFQACHDAGYDLLTTMPDFVKPSNQ